jgi:2-haloacid dehalogenase
MAIKALMFDVFGTVVDWRGSVALEAQSLLGEAKGIEADWFAFADGWRAKYLPAMGRVERGELPRMPLDDLHRMNLVELLNDFGISGLSEGEVDHLNRAWHRLEPWPDAAEGLERLKAKHVVAAHSNGNIALIVNMAKRGGFSWDVILGAEVVRAFKPEPDAYTRAPAILGIKPDECVMVSTHHFDLAAAAEQGFRTAFVRRPLELGPERRAEKEPQGTYDYMCDDFLDLAEKLRC